MKKKISKKIASIILIAIVVCSIFPLASTNASAVNITQSSAVTWAKAQIGKSLDYDGNYGAQCVDLIKYYYAQFGFASYAKGNGKEYATNKLPPNWKRYSRNDSGFSVQQGDILIWNKTTYKKDGNTVINEYGHVAISISTTTNINNIRMVTQNPGAVHESGMFNTGTGYFWGVIRPEYSDSTSSNINFSVMNVDTYYLKNKSTGMYLTVDEKNDEANISVSSFNGSDMQKFILCNDIGGTYTLNPIFNKSLGISPYWFTGKIPYGAGNNVTLYPATGETNNDQHWGFEAVSGGYILHNMKDDTYVMGLDDNNAQLVTKTGADDQIWIIEQAYSEISIGTYYLKNKSSGTYMTVDEKKDDANISVKAYSGNEMQKFVLNGTDKKYTLSPIYKQSLNINPYYLERNNLPNGASVTVYKSSGEWDNDQHWGFESVSGGYIIHNMKDQSLVLGLDGTNIQVETRSDASDQIWVLESATTVNKSYLDVNGIINGEKALPLDKYVTFDVYLNGKLEKSSVGDFYEELAVGTTYEIKNITPLDGYSYDGVSSGTLKGTVGNEETIVCLAFSPIDENSPQIIIEQVNASPGNDLKVKIALKNNPGLASLKLTLTYGDDLTLTSIKYGSSLGGTSQQPQTYSSPVILNWYNGVENTNGDIEYAELSFKLSASAALGNVIPITATFNPNDVFDINEKNISFAVVNGSVTVNTHTPGDINDDGELNNKDVVQLFKYLSGWDIKINLAAADCNGDGERDNKDVVILFKYLSGWNVEIK